MSMLQTMLAWVLSRPGRSLLVYILVRVVMAVGLAITTSKAGELVLIFLLVVDLFTGWSAANQAYGAIWNTAWHEGVLRRIERAFHVLPAIRTPANQQLLVLPEVDPDAPAAASYAKVKEAYDIMATHMLLEAQMRKGEARLKEIMGEFADRAGYEVEGKDEAKDLKQ